MNPLLELKQQGQQIWLDNLSRTLLREGVRLFVEPFDKLLALMDA